MRTPRRWGLACLLPWLATIAFAQAPTGRQPLQSDVRDPDWVTQARSLATGQTLHVAGLRGPDGLEDATLVVQRFEVVAPGGRVVVHGVATSEHEFPARTYLRGRIAGHPGSHATLAIGADQSVRGLLQLADRRLALQQPAHGAAELHELAQEKTADGFTCGNGSHVLDAPDLPPAATHAVPTPKGGEGPSFTARIAIETDHEYFALFASEEDATVYAMDLVAFASGIYEDEVDTALSISHLSLWPSADDPWGQASSSCKLYEFGKYWNDERGDVQRTIAHFLSGTTANAGIAWIGVLCDGAFNYNIGSGCTGISGTANFGGAYGVTGGIDGNFDLTAPAPVWDIIAFAHEVGHNFNSPHSHCYGGIGGNGAPVDTCYNGEGGAGCHVGSTSLPCATPGAGCGTVMSYCHLLSPGLSNLAFSLGTGHPHGVAPERVPTRMMQHVLAREDAFPGCLTGTAVPVLTLAAATEVGEGQALPVTLQLDRPAVVDIRVDLAVDPALDGAFASLSGHTIVAGESSLEVSLPTVDDAVHAADRSGTLTVSTVDSLAPVTLGVPSSAPVTILDDDAAAPVEVDLAVAAPEVIEGGTLAFTLSLDQPTSVAVDVSLALAAPLAVRVASGLGPHRIAAGASSAEAAIAFDDDLLPQADASAMLSIDTVDSMASHTIAADHAASITLLDNDVTVTLHATAGVLYEGRALEVQLQLDRAAGSDIHVELGIEAALGGLLGNLTGHVIPAGDTVLPVLLPAVDDSLRNDAATGELRIASASGSASVGAAVGTPSALSFRIEDDESPLFSDSFEPAHANAAAATTAWAATPTATARANTGADSDRDIDRYTRPPSGRYSNAPVTVPGE